MKTDHNENNLGWALLGLGLIVLMVGGMFLGATGGF